MSARTVHSPGRLISFATRESIIDLGIKIDDYAANIEDALRIRGEHELADRMLQEIEQSLAQQRTANSMY